MFFHDDNPTPFMIYEDESLGFGTGQIRLTAEGSKNVHANTNGSGAMLLRLVLTTTPLLNPLTSRRMLPTRVFC